MTISNDRSVRVWTTDPVGEVGAFELPVGQRRADGVDVVAGRVMAHISTAEESGLTAIFDLGGNVLATIDGTASQNARLSPDGELVAAQQALDTSTIGTVRVHEASTGDVVQEMSGLCEYEMGADDCLDQSGDPFDLAWDLAFSPDQELLVMGGRLNRTFTAWDVRSGAVAYRSDPLWEGGPRGGPIAVAFRADGSALAVAGYNFLQNVDPRSWQVRERTQLEPRVSLLAVRFSPDGSAIVGRASDGTVRIYDAGTLTLIGDPIEAHDGLTRDVEISPDGEELITAGQDSFLRVWELASGHLLDVIPMPDGAPAQNVEFIEGTDHILATSNTGAAMRFTLDFDELIGIARERVDRDLTEEECQTYLRRSCE
jgi:WD40 repeat protein